MTEWLYCNWVPISDHRSGSSSLQTPGNALRGHGSHLHHIHHCNSHAVVWGYTAHQVLMQFLPPVQTEIHSRELLQSRPADEIVSILAAVMADGFNISPDTMAQITPGISYWQLQRITDWQLTNETQRAALVDVVNAIARLDITSAWGEGKTSSSDGQRFAFRRKVLQKITVTNSMTTH